MHALHERAILRPRRGLKSLHYKKTPHAQLSYKKRDFKKDYQLSRGIFSYAFFLYQKGHGRKGRWDNREDGAPDELT
jgi:hypothetical protein